ncbi:MAG: glycosyl hydrolase family 9, partial [Bacteroidales bacterium]|nr:glycosyl hydrolase family 9 [Bacteroidales bacterium]
MRKLLFLFLIAFPFITVSSQIDEKLIFDIKNTGYIHRPLPLDHSKSYETFAVTKKVLVSEMLCDMEDLSKWSHSGVGGMRLTSERSISGKRSLRLVAPTIPEKHPGWGLGMGTSMASFDVGG